MPDWLPTWMQSPAFLGAAGVASVVTLVGSALLLPWLAARLPSDYFVRQSKHGPFHQQHAVLAILGHLLKNVLGLLLVLAGVAMLVLPGQGLLTMLAGLVLIDFPRKRQIELAIVRRKPVARALAWLRERAGAPPLKLEPESDSAGGEAQLGLERGGVTCAPGDSVYGSERDDREAQVRGVEVDAVEQHDLREQDAQ